MDNIKNATPSNTLCSHTFLEPERAYGGPTGNSICKTCGCLFSPKVQQKALVNYVRQLPDTPLRLPTFIV